ncbi:carcinoembryonic antigen-related cell adhesion molecule 1-like [Solea senegalensis]|uniref:Carcinoembryonic antigen-related cell adhesion molecule 1-like n=1 Tax=Solea senegalensis TaxID=28829 RepID=A0AAV6PRQ5_SOLSE|nr:carcinoembryonic antigen-related cell adhesion molecule 1-like isoform X2 [Solea senegalensis]KAG7474047.1 carcinoembryonic antigen-related cell adhesion molecule 1-like [Solea senegalensis]
MKNTFLCSVVLVLLSTGLCHGSGVITVDFLRGATGESVTFTTSVKPAAEPFLALTWSFNTTVNVVTSTSVDIVGQGYENRIVLDKSTGSLVLSNVTEKDSGEYELIIIPHGGEHIQGTVELEVLTAVSNPSISCPTENLIEGKSSVNITCDADGLVSSTLWLKDGKPLVSGDRFSFHHGNRVLSISPIDRKDTGLILCNVSNAISYQTAECRLHVYYGPDKPTVTQKPRRAEMEEKVSLSCFAESLPEATFFWTFRNRKIPGPVVHIKEMEEHHLGAYTCTARNAVTHREASEVHRLRDSSPIISGSMSMMVCTVLTSGALMLI